MGGTPSKFSFPTISPWLCSTYDFKGTNAAIPTIYNIIHIYSGCNNERKRNGHNKDQCGSVSLSTFKMPWLASHFGGAKIKQPRHWNLQLQRMFHTWMYLLPTRKKSLPPAHETNQTNTEWTKTDHGISEYLWHLAVASVSSCFGDTSQGQQKITENYSSSKKWSCYSEAKAELQTFSWSAANANSIWTWKLANGLEKRWEWDLFYILFVLKLSETKPFFEASKGQLLAVCSIF